MKNYVYLLLLFLMLFAPDRGYTASYYMATTGSNGNPGTVDQPWLTLQYSMSQMSGGDTLIIKDGSYTGTANVVDSSHLPPSGSAGAYTYIKAENTGGVTFDGEATRNMFALQGSGVGNGPHHIQFEGIGWYNTLTTLNFVLFCEYIKFIDCWVAEVNGTGQEGGDGFYVGYSNYVLYEGCFSWGNARKHFYIGNSARYIVVRRCVVRHDRFFDYEDQESFMVYDSRDVELQNCISIDGDQYDYYTPTGSAKSFTTRTAAQTVDNVFYRGCISLANNGMMGWLGSNDVGATVVDSIHWDSILGTRIRGAGHSFNHFTTGVVSGSSTSSPLAYLEAGDPINNSLLYSAYQGIWNADGSSDYNSLYSVTQEYVGSASEGAHDKSNANSNAIDPTDGTPGNGIAALKYLVRIESGSDLDGAASDSGAIGATILKKIGVAGTYYGDTGYNTVTDDELWPFPNEDLIKTKMASYTWDDGGGGDHEITGARGFAASGKQLNDTDDITLTSYIWEYLGNEMPSDIYGEEESATFLITGISSISGAQFQ